MIPGDKGWQQLAIGKGERIGEMKGDSEQLQWAKPHKIKDSSGNS